MALSSPQFMSLVLSVVPILAGNAAHAACVDGEIRCSNDAFEVLECSNDRWITQSACMADSGQLCESGQCVQPWHYGSLDFNTCEGDPHATAANLGEKAIYYDDIAARVHIHPEVGRISDVTLRAGADGDTATWQDVSTWTLGPSEGLWSGLYAASQAFRYHETHSTEALANLDLLLTGIEDAMASTGVSGLFPRVHVPPGIEGYNCPSDPMAYTIDPTKDNNRWVLIGEGGHLSYYDESTSDWIVSDVAAPPRLAGGCFMDNVSKDSYTGYMMALGAMWMAVDDPGIRTRSAALLEAVSEHLMVNDMALVDWDGKLTEHGRLWPTTLDDFPGLNAAMGLAFVKMGAMASGREDLQSFYDNCLLQKDGRSDCLDRYATPPYAFDSWLAGTGMYPGPRSCKGNWNRFGMMFVSMFDLVYYERNGEKRQYYQRLFEDLMYYHKGNEREMAAQGNAAWGLIYSGLKDTGPGSSGQDEAAIYDSLCGLQQFPERQSQPRILVDELTYPEDRTCPSRSQGEFLTFEPVPVYLRCPDSFIWWRDPYRHQDCEEDALKIKQPGDYLLPYWMARYFGHISETD